MTTTIEASESAGMDEQELSILNKKFLKMVNTLIKKGIVKDYKDFCLRIGADKSTISRIKPNGRNVTLNQIQQAIVKFDLNANFFFNNDHYLFLWESREKRETITSFGDNSPVNHIKGSSNNFMHVGNGVFYEQIANHIYQGGTHKEDKKVATMLELNRNLRAKNEEYKETIDELQERLDLLEEELAFKRKEVLDLKDELLDVYRKGK